MSPHGRKRTPRDPGTVPHKSSREARCTGVSHADPESVPHSLRRHWVASRRRNELTGRQTIARPPRVGSGRAKLTTGVPCLCRRISQQQRFFGRLSCTPPMLFRLRYLS